MPRLFRDTASKSESNSTSFRSKEYSIFKGSRRYREVDDISLGQVPLSYTTVQAERSQNEDLGRSGAGQEFASLEHNQGKPAILQTISIDQESTSRSP